MSSLRKLVKFQVISLLALSVVSCAPLAPSEPKNPPGPSCPNHDPMNTAFNTVVANESQLNVETSMGTNHNTYNLGSLTTFEYVPDSDARCSKFYVYLNNAAQVDHKEVK